MNITLETHKFCGDLISIKKIIKLGNWNWKEKMHGYYFLGKLIYGKPQLLVLWGVREVARKRVTGNRAKLVYLTNLLSST